MNELKLFGQRLKEVREEKNLTTRELGEMLGTTAATISRYETGIHDPKRVFIQQTASTLNVNPAWLMGANVDKYIEKDDLMFKRVPILGTIAAGQPILAEEHIEGYEYVPENSNIDFCLRVKGDSMINARIYDGDIVYIRKQPDVENGEIAAVIVDGENATLKRVYKINGSVILRPENQNYKEMVFSKKDLKEVNVLGKAIFFKSEVR